MYLGLGLVCHGFERPAYDACNRFASCSHNQSLASQHLIAVLDTRARLLCVVYVYLLRLAEEFGLCQMQTWLAGLPGTIHGEHMSVMRVMTLRQEGDTAE